MLNAFSTNQMHDTIKIEFIPNVQPFIDINTSHDSISKWFNDCYVYIHDTLLVKMQNDPSKEIVKTATDQLSISDKALFDTEATFEAIDIIERTSKGIDNETKLENGSITINKIHNEKLAKQLDDIKKVVEKITADVSAINAKLDTKNNASMSLMMLMNDKTFQEIQEIEKQVIYRRFYFPGGEPKKIIVQSKSELKRWDPRTIDEYIVLAKQQGFHRFFIYYNGFDFKHISFTQAATVLKNCIDWSSQRIFETGGCDKLDVCGIIAGLIYFDKVDSFFEEITTIGANKTMFNKLCDAYADIIDPMIEKIANVLVHQTQNNFKKNNYGWMAEDDNLAFDSGKYVAQLVTLKAQYEMYKDRVWKILEDLNALEVCTNYTNITGNNLSIDQKMQCALSISQSAPAQTNIPSVQASSTQEPTKDDSIIVASISQTSPVQTSSQNTIPSETKEVSDNSVQGRSALNEFLSDKELFYTVIIITVIFFILLVFVIIRKSNSHFSSTQAQFAKMNTID